jgi:hypothetical protein
MCWIGYGAMKKAYTIYAALSDEANEGWIWFSCPPIRTRTIVKVYHPKNNRAIFCVSRNIDPNFRTQYNDRQHTLNIQNSCEALVISQWYRDALGDFETKKGQVELEITPARIWGWRSIRACCHHPEIAVRVGTRLGVLGAWLGIIGLAAALLNMADIKGSLGVIILITLAALGGVVGSIVCRGVKRPVN